MTATHTIPNQRTSGSPEVPAADDLQRLPESVLVDRLRSAGEAWEELLGRLTASGTLPSIELAEQVTSFFVGELRHADAVHAELMRRWIVTEVARQPRPVEFLRGIDGR